MTARKNDTPATPPPSTTITLTQLMASLRTLGINVSSPHEEMLQESASSSTSPSPPGEPSATANAPAPLCMDALVTALRTLGVDVGNTTSRGSMPAGSSAAPAPAATAAPTAPHAHLSAGGRALSGLPPLPAGGTITSGTGAIASLSPASIPLGAAAGSAPRPQDTTNPISGFVCVNCNTHNLVRPARETWYVVTVGLQVGVFQGWHSTQPLVSSVSGACYRKYPSQEDAVAAFQEALDNGHVHSVAPINQAASL
ncbi:hypothetical protein D9611_008215 [Ephemerocybe angulata]|uniref:Ribonuclease H1 N-terminal domain-containing protein n=1 Tax=Ephemerocybe angulata TaxID=980116 RepID=A0A8H5F5J8_9AGAR|nr:hypothetical protein D9611_008215 [Tulosesus angulatus]